MYKIHSIKILVNICLHASWSLDLRTLLHEGQVDRWFRSIDVFVTLECIHLYILCIVPQCLFQEV